MYRILLLSSQRRIIRVLTLPHNRCFKMFYHSLLKPYLHLYFTKKHVCIASVKSDKSMSCVVCLQLMESGMAYCTCPLGFFGDHCELHRPCNVYSCKNNATCIHTPLTDVCNCKPGFAGKYFPIFEYVHICCVRQQQAMSS